MLTPSSSPLLLVIQTPPSIKGADLLRPLAGKPLLQWVVERASAVRHADRMVVSLSESPRDDVAAAYCKEKGLAWHRGHAVDLLERCVTIAGVHAAGQVVRVTATCPFLDPEIIDQVIEEHLTSGRAATRWSEAPLGVRFEILSAAVLAQHCEDERDPQVRNALLLPEPAAFPSASGKSAAGWNDMRWTVELPADVEWGDQVLRALAQRSEWGISDVAAIVAKLPLPQALPDASAMGPLEGAGQQLYQRAKRRIPGGTQLLSKRPEMYLPGRWPAYYASAKGVWVTDLDGRSYIDMSTNGLGAIVLGAGDPVVDGAVREAVSRGSMSTLNAPEEVELADLLCELHPWAEMVRLARTGGEAMSIAVRIARAAAGKDKVLFCGYHGWSDWYLAANIGAATGLDKLLLPGLRPAGVPSGLAGSVLPFHFNNREEFDALVSQNGGQTGVIVMEAVRNSRPDPEFLQHVRDTATQLGAVLIFDEITSGFRLTCGGAHLLYGVMPDVAVFGKAIANGYAMSAVIGRSSVMEAAQGSFISSTFWTERIGPAAALATIRRHREIGAHRLLIAAGEEVQRIWQECSATAGLKVACGPDEMKPLSHFSVQGPPAEQRSIVRTLWCQLMLERGFLDNSGFYATCSHGEAELSRYEAACTDAFAVLARAIESGKAEEMAGEPAHSSFQRLT